MFSACFRERARKREPQTRGERNMDKPGLVYDVGMRGHECTSSHPECPDRITRIWGLLEERGLVERCHRVEARKAKKEEILKIHSEKHYVAMEKTQEMSDGELLGRACGYNSIYLHQMTFPCALLAAGSVVEMTELVLQGKLPSGAAVVRPPGHHALSDKCMGFCIFNSVAIAARVAIDNYNISRVLIVDWDVHHGNATQEQFYDDNRVLYFSLHRYDNGSFYPNLKSAGPTHVGGASAKGYNVNMAWSGEMMGDPEYLSAFHHLLLPIATEFNPELVLVSAGFDAARGDPLGRYHISPAGYAHMTHLLQCLAGGKMVIALEGGYNLTSISKSMAACVSVLLGDPLPPLPDDLVPNDDGVQCIREAVSAHIPYWKSLRLFGGATPRAKVYIDNSEDFEPTQPPESNDQPPESHDQPPESHDQPPESHEQQSESHDQPLESHEQQSESHDQPPESRDQPPTLPNQSLVSHDKPPPSPPESHEQASVSHDQPVGVASAAVASDAPDQLLSQLRELSVGEGMWFAVTPKTFCQHLVSLSPEPLPHDIASRRCEECNEAREPWVCLQCHRVLCGRYVNKHMLAHSEGCGHFLAISLTDISVWCFPCDSYLDHASLRPACSAVHCSKFGEDIPST